MKNFDVLKSRKDKRDAAEAYNNAVPKKKELRVINTGDKVVNGITISPDGRFITYRLFKPSQGKNTIVPSYVTESGFTEDIPGRTKVGGPQGTQELFVFDSGNDTAIAIKTDAVPGIKDIPAFYNDYPQLLKRKTSLVLIL